MSDRYCGQFPWSHYCPLQASTVYYRPANRRGRLDNETVGPVAFVQHEKLSSFAGDVHLLTSENLSATM